ncbi:hypothetical protein FRX31_013840 [Thalictrum thalictroides]|uniref:Uncharacterized protein n=1 Tax=Thalictrum thalictroides TaxID=46969 RepID=A0A7J6WGL0_THATH|nr:hypothetical protein FRX31_013840 [Thalictrum thalictroides]
MAGVEEWKKFFEREGSGFNIFDTIHCAIAVASLLKPEEFKRHRDEIVAEIMVATQQTSKNNKVNNSTVHQQASKIKLDKQSSSRSSTLTKVDDKIIKTTSTCTATGISAAESLDEESFHKQKLEISKRKLQQGYQQVAAAKKQRTVKVLESNELPKKVLGRSSHLHGQNNRKLYAV